LKYGIINIFYYLALNIQIIYFIHFRRGWDKYVVDEKEVSASSSIPLGWILPLEPCNNDWAKYSNNVNVL